jgi:plastocyanin
MIHAALLALALSGEPTVTVKGKVTVHKSDGSVSPDASDVVVFVADVDAPVKGAKASIKQKNRQFEPRLSVVVQGTELQFPNEDTLAHNVFSNSPDGKFDIGLYPKGPGKTWVADKPALIDVYCNVHPEMVAYLVVTPSKLFAVTGKDGSFEIKGVPAGKHKLTVWERFARPRLKAVDVDAAEGREPLEISIDERATADDPHKDKKDTNYKGHGW